MALGSLVDSPLQQNPLAGGGLGALTDEQREAFMKARGPEVEQPEVYTNPVTKEILDGYSKSDFFTMSPQQDVATIEINGLPYTSNSAGVGALREYMKSIGKENMITGNGGLLQPLDTNFKNYGGGNVGPNITESGTLALIDPNKQEYKSDDPIMQGYYDSEFFKPNAPTTMDVVNYTYQGKPMQGSSSNIGQFQQYLDSVGKGDLIQRDNGIMSAQTPGLQDLLTNTGEQTPPGFGPPPTPTIPKLGSAVGFPVTVSGDDSIATTATANPYQEQFTGFGNQLTGFGDQLTGFGDQFGGLDKQFNTINTRLNSMDEGIAGLSELLQPQQKLYNSPYSNFNFSSNSYSNPSPFGLGSLFGRRY